MSWIISIGLGKKFILLAISLELIIFLDPALSVIPAQRLKPFLAGYSPQIDTDHTDERDISISVCRE